MATWDSRIPEGPYFVSADDAEDCPDHKHSGLAKVDTGRSDDWPIARLCEWPTARLIAVLPELWKACQAIEAADNYDEIEAAKELAREAIVKAESGGV